MVDSIEVDVSKLDVAEYIHSDAVQLPKGLRFANHEKFTIATITSAVSEVVETSAPESAEVPSAQEEKAAKKAETKEDAK